MNSCTRLSHSVLYWLSIHGKLGVVFREMRVCVLFLNSRKGVSVHGCVKVRITMYSFT